MSSQEQHLLGQHRERPEANARRAELGATIQLREEELDARTQAIETGQVTVRSEVVQEQKRLDVPVTREEVSIERHPVDRRPSEAPISASSHVLEVPVHAEQVTAQKQAVVYEDVKVGKRAIHDAQQVSATLRKEVVDVDAEGDLQVDDETTNRL
jgi:uncharacterized protein (TIGR02271 family)